MKVKSKTIGNVLKSFQHICRIISVSRYHTHLDIQATFRKQRERIDEHIEVVKKELPDNFHNDVFNRQPAPFTAPHTIRAKWAGYTSYTAVKA